MGVAICPGSYDPVNLGHLDIIRRASRIFDEVVVLVTEEREGCREYFTAEERTDMLRRVTADLPNVSVERFDGMIAEYARRYDRAIVIKGLRAATDFESEFQKAQINKSINRELETMFLSSSQQFTFLSSSVVMELANHGASLEKFVPREIIADVEAKAGGKKHG